MHPSCTNDSTRHQSNEQSHKQSQNHTHNRPLNRVRERPHGAHDPLSKTPLRSCSKRLTQHHHVRFSIYTSAKKRL